MFRPPEADEVSSEALLISALAVLQNEIDAANWATDAETLGTEINALPAAMLKILHVDNGVVSLRHNLHSLSIALDGAAVQTPGVVPDIQDKLTAALVRYYSLREASRDTVPGFVSTYHPGEDLAHAASRVQHVLASHGIIPIPVFRLGRETRDVIMEIAILAAAYGDQPAAILVPDHPALFEAAPSNEPMMSADDPELIKGYDTGPNLAHATLGSIISFGKTPIIGPARAQVPLIGTIANRLTLAYQIPQPSFDDKIAEIRAVAASIPGQTIPESGIVAIARMDLSPSQRRQAVYSTVMTGSAQAAMEVLARSSASLAPAIAVADLDFSLYVCKENLAELLERMKAAPRGQMPVLIDGVAGTGKSAFARYAAHAMGYQSKVYRYADLTSRWLSESEKAIDKMFADARRHNFAIVMDEVESMFADRETATHDYQKTLTNAFLTHLDSHDLPVFCSTNHKRDIDPAILRRFVFKLDFQALTPELAARAFTRFFSLPAPREVLHLEHLTPGDFDVVRKRANILGINDDPNWFVDALRDELSHKKSQSPRIGFVTH
ncbi:ATP-binding protein [Microvirga sp. BT688]|uniref:AAA family ATPase n=1 Tax=Microvirga sp. TaxID=1873136 RepID=UPI001684BBC1|nr:ATP-binding protein [Microvirga sp.]MBD2745739.1 ATP-binding protein [Microvirga sp.]